MPALAAGMTARLHADKKKGLLFESFERATVVPIIVTYMQGIWRMALVDFNRPQMEQQIGAFLTALGL